MTKAITIYPVRLILSLLACLVLGSSLAYAQDTDTTETDTTETDTVDTATDATETDMADMPMSETPAEAMGLLQEFLVAGVDSGPTPKLVALSRNLRLTIESTEDETLQVVGLAVSPVEEALAADPFDLNDLTSALDSLALEMRSAADAGPDDADLLTEMASLVDQASAFMTETDFTPRLEVEQP